MIDLKTVLDYQQVDLELKKISAELEKSDDAKKLEHARNEFNGAKQMVAEAEKAAEGIIKFFQSAENYYDENSRKVSEAEKALEALPEEDEKRGEIIAQLEMLRDKFADLEKKLAERRDKSEKVIRAYLEAQDKGRKMREAFNNIKSRIEAAKKAVEPRQAELEAQLASLRAKVDKELMKLYDALAAEKKYPVLVSAGQSGKELTCGGCGMFLSQKTKSELSDKGYCRCDTCRRIIYK